MPWLSRRLLLSAAVLCAIVARVEAEEWPCWRGPRGDGTSLEEHIPVRWSASENIGWKVAIAGVGHASPIVWQDRIFLVTCLTETGDRVLMCLDRRTGRTLWQQTVVTTPLEEKHELNSYASSTPATDGESVYVTFLDRDDMVVAAFDLEGRRRWLVRPGEFHSKHGYCTCPVLFEDKVIVNGDHDGDAYLVALRRTDGNTLWKTPRENKTRSYVTPLVRTIDGQPHLILSGSKSVASYDPRSGKCYWVIDGPTEQFVASMVYNGTLLFMTAGYPDHHILAIRPDGHGNVTDTHIAWRTTENTSYVPSPIVVGEYFLVVADNGIASCYEANSGRRLWKERIGRRYSASLVTAGGLVYFTSDDGVTTVVRPGPTFDAVATNDLGEPCFASPAISRGQVFQRGEKHLYAIRAADNGNASGDADGSKK
ncbi:MAG: PQQ-binding-like beta-propeller repeat protein [Planctomycetia bacterium]|nr:PQQ-binding-like beta-propeller repeat protein [Planctomycetia bacterium]